MSVIPLNLPAGGLSHTRMLGLIIHRDSTHERCSGEQIWSRCRYVFVCHQCADWQGEIDDCKSGGTGDADLYVRLGVPPTISSYQQALRGQLPSKTSPLTIRLLAPITFW